MEASRRHQAGNKEIRNPSLFFQTTAIIQGPQEDEDWKRMRRIKLGGAAHVVIPALRKLMQKDKEF